MSKRPVISISSPISSTSQQIKVAQLSRHLNIPVSVLEDCMDGFQLVYTDNRLELRVPAKDKLQKQWILFTDFVGGSSGYRRIHNNTIKQPLARAVGIKKGFRPTIVDATAGMGEDGFVFACLGCQVTLVERSPIIAALLQDGLDRAADNSSTARIVQENMHLIVGDARKVLHSLSHSPYSIYLDPMYPHKTKSALNKKEMRMIRAIVGDDQDAGALFSTSLQYASNRVVVKRPKGAETVTSLSPSHQIEMKNSRFDVYLVHHL